MVRREMTTEREKALELAIGQIEKRFGKGSIMKLGESATLPPIAAIPTGSLALDLALGVGGIPRGRITEIFGPEASGKTTLAQHIIAEAQKEEVRLPILMRSMPWTPLMLPIAVSALMTCSFHNRIPASRLWRLPKRW
jgi:hypothetical protein